MLEDLTLEFEGLVSKEVGNRSLLGVYGYSVN